MTDRSDNVIPLRPRKRGALCPICAKPSAAEYRPFCSKRCADIDLHKWLGERYRVEADELPDDEPRDDNDPA
tara:strand:- start:272 stop:487 length:216 start_codon:yes stop_codon:yes gene_type:complete